MFRTLLVLALLASCASESSGDKPAANTASRLIFGEDFSATVTRCDNLFSEVDLVNNTDQFMSFEVTITFTQVGLQEARPEIGTPSLLKPSLMKTWTRSQVVRNLSPGGGQMVLFEFNGGSSRSTLRCSVTARIR